MMNAERLSIGARPSAAGIPVRVKTAKARIEAVSFERLPGGTRRGSMASIRTGEKRAALRVQGGVRGSRTRLQRQTDTHLDAGPRNQSSLRIPTRYRRHPRGN